MSEGDPPSVTDDEAKSDALDALISEKEVEDGTSAASFIHQLQIVAQAGGRIEELFVRVEALERENGELRERVASAEQSAALRPSGGDFDAEALAAALAAARAAHVAVPSTALLRPPRG